MTTKAGVWIDYNHAAVYVLGEDARSDEKIAFDFDKRLQAQCGAKHEVVGKNRLERKINRDRINYFEHVIATLEDATSLLIVGPDDAKEEFTKHIEAKKLRGLTIELETSGKVSRSQFADHVIEHFAKASVGKRSAKKKTATKKPATISSRKGGNKSAKKIAR